MYERLSVLNSTWEGEGEGRGGRGREGRFENEDVLVGIVTGLQMCR